MRSNQAFLNLLKAKAGVRTLIFITDAGRIQNPERVIRFLPQGSFVILRDYDHPFRGELAYKLRNICKLSSVGFLVAGDLKLAKTVKADGVHLPEYMLFDHNVCQKLKEFTLVTAACHSRRAMNRAALLGVTAALVSPVFQTRSHVGERGMGVHTFARLIKYAPLPIIALGGISSMTAGRRGGLDITGIAAIDGIANGERHER